MMQQQSEQNPPEAAAVALSTPATAVQTPQVFTVHQRVIKEEDQTPENKKQWGQNWPETAVCIPAPAVQTQQGSTGLTNNNLGQRVKEEDQPSKMMQQQREKHLSEAGGGAVSNPAAAVQTPHQFSTGLANPLVRPRVGEEDQAPKKKHQRGGILVKAKLTAKNTDGPLPPDHAAALQDRSERRLERWQAMVAASSRVSAIRAKLLKLPAGGDNSGLRQKALNMCESFRIWQDAQHICHTKGEITLRMTELEMCANLLLQGPTAQAADDAGRGRYKFFTCP